MTDLPREPLPREAQTFPILTDAEVARIARLGCLVRFPDGAALSETGKIRPGMYVIRSGTVVVTQRDGLGHVTPIVDLGTGQFLAELGQLSHDQPALVDARARGAVEAILIPSARIRSLLMAEAELGERIMRAMILRRVALISSGAGGAVLIGAPGAGAMPRLQAFLTRNGIPHHVVDPSRDDQAAQIVAHLQPTPAELPLVVCPDGRVLHNPDEPELARGLGIIGFAGDEVYDVAIVGAGPAGLSTAVYAASEGLSVVVLEAWAFGGQAGASARIENYFGFPTGISGQALAGRAYAQAQKFGAEIRLPVSVQSLDCSRTDGTFGLIVDGGARLRARAVVVASGARYRRPAIADLSRFEGRGVWYWASPIEAKTCAGQEVILVGGGNSAGQAAVYLSTHCAKVHMFVRGPSLSATMSRYLIERIEATPNIELSTRTEITALEGTPDLGLDRVHWRNAQGEREAPIHHVFLFVGADPATSWLANCGVQLDRTGFILTGHPGQAPLESSVPGVYAVGDVRASSIKRVGSAIGEGAQVVAALHGFLAQNQP